MASENNGAFIRNIAEVPWREFPTNPFLPTIGLWGQTIRLTHGS